MNLLADKKIANKKGSENMKERNLKILSKIVELFADSNCGISSLLLSRYFDFSASTIRNAMSELESEGFLKKAGKFSGSFPTSKAFIYLLEKEKEYKFPDRSEVEDKINLTFEKANFINILEKTSILLSEMTGCQSLIRGPSFLEQNIKEAKIEVIKNDYGVLSLLFDTGFVKAQCLHLEKLSKKVKEINKKIAKSSFIEIVRLLELKIFQLRSEFFVGNLTFKNNIKPLINLILADADKDVSTPTIIFDENLGEEFKGNSLVFLNFSIGNHKGVLGIFGPFGMNYSRNISLMLKVRNALEKRIKKLQEEMEK